MKHDVIILPHLGLGDHFMSYGVVRKIHDEMNFNNVYLVCKEANLKNLQYAFNGTNIKYLVIPKEVQEGINHTEYASNLLKQNNFPGFNVQHPLKVWKCGDELKVDEGPGTLLIDRWFYCMVPEEIQDDELYIPLGFTIEDKYNSFKKINRDTKKEDEVYRKIITDDAPYVFVTDDPSRNYTIDIKKALGYDNIKVIRSHEYPEYTLFDLLKVIEKAHSVHVMYNGWLTLIDALELNKIYLHTTYFNKINSLESYGWTMLNFMKIRNISVV